ncbi:hypothetical protein PIB30_041600 [Stylosanthes scabra]|uniref:RRM domain-containing protein n=1 Tax=Stylosanthes scabra TaxID=79078 RepID=A0ABU6VF18_9FABA|nr:hypothetical protein [Stylosanthes scabra]
MRWTEENNAFTIFVDNLPFDATNGWVRKVFNSVGEVVDVFVSMKRRERNPLRFAFVRYASRDKALRAVEQLDGWLVWGNCLKTLGESRVYLKSDNEKLEKLERAAVGETMNPYEFIKLKEEILKEWDTAEEIKMLGSMKVLLVFNSKQSRDEALESEALIKHFLEVRRWIKLEVNRALIDSYTGPSIQAYMKAVIDELKCLLYVREIGTLGVYADGGGKDTENIAGSGAMLDRDAVPEKANAEEENPKSAEKGGGATEDIDAETQRSRVEETQEARENEEGGDSGRPHAENSNPKGPDASWASPSITKTLEDDRRTEDVIQGKLIENGLVYERNATENDNNMELAQDVSSQDLGHSDDSVSTSLSAPPGFEPTYRIIAPGQRKWRQIKESQKLRVSGGEKSEGRARAPRRKSKKVTSLKLKDRVIGALQGAKKGVKRKKGKEIPRIEDAEWWGEQNVDEDSEDIECTYEDFDRMWWIGREAGFDADEDGDINHYLKDSRRKNAEQAVDGPCRKQRNRRKRASKKVGVSGNYTQ